MATMHNYDKKEKKMIQIRKKVTFLYENLSFMQPTQQIIPSKRRSGI